MQIKEDTTRQTAAGNFNCEIGDDALSMPTTVFAFAQTYRLGTAEAFAGYTDAFPSTVAHHFNWTVDQSKAATTGLLAALIAKGVMEKPKPVVRRAFGLNGNGTP